MASRTRKPPEPVRKGPIKKTGRGAQKKGATARSRPHFLLRGCSALLGLAARNPAIFGGSATFAIVFGFVAANALWYQPSSHPSPFLRTRLPFTHPNPASLSPATREPQTGKVTTFVIERAPDVADADLGPSVEEVIAAEDAARADTMAPASERTASLPPAGTGPAHLAPARLAQPTDSAANEPDEAELVRAVQAALIDRGLYDGPADGRSGPKTMAAIRAYERATGLPETGLATPALQAALAARQNRAAQNQPPQRMPSVTPVTRPSAEKSKSSTGALDPVAAAIRAADEAPVALPKADIPASDATVMAIQRGLKNLAYADVTVDGMAGEQTRAAIRHFEKHYRLPETGEPNPAVLKKMKEIGAL